MSDLRNILWLVPGLPLLAAFVTAFLGPRLLRRHSHWPCIAALAGAFVAAAIVLNTVASVPAGEGGHSDADTTQHQSYYSWIESGLVHVDFALRADPLTAVMVTMITFVGTLIAIFAVGYMDGDPGYPRFFAAVSLFIFSMTTLVLADNLIVLYAGWEGVGVCSYLLIGFWFNKPAAAAAARKAFLVTRIGDVGLMLGILLLWSTCGYHLDYDGIFKCVRDNHDKFAGGGVLHGTLITACLLLLCGAAGKSAQFPLHVWLPDAMEGPTPVSALIHAATMVTAGVYLIARCTPLFAFAPEAQIVVACMGGFTAIFAALIGLTQTDLKRVLAYSTLSQLGYMFLSLGCALEGEAGLVTFAVAAAVFHLITHAFFKALLFLSAGSVMHAMGGVIDMRRFSGLRKVLPTTHWTFLCGALALSGFPLLSGFWSKDEIVDAALKAGESSREYSAIYYTLFVVALVTAALTAFYTFRAYFMTFWGELKVPPEAGTHGGHGDDEEHGHDHGHAPAPTAGHGAAHGGVAHESPPVMTIPLMILAGFALGIGFVLGPTEVFAGFLRRATTFAGFAHVESGMNFGLMGFSSLIAIGGIAVAWLFYVKSPELPGRLARAVPALYQASLNKFYFDELYGAFIVRPLLGFSHFAAGFDKHVVDELVVDHLAGKTPSFLGWVLRPIQNGLVQFYALAMALSLAVILAALLRSL